VPVVAPAVDTVSAQDNNFFFNTGFVDPNLNDTSATFGKVFKSIGAHHVASLGLEVSAASVAVATGAVNSARLAGLSGGYLNTQVAIGTTDWTPYVLAMKSANVDGFLGTMDPTSNLGLVVAAQQQGLNLKAVIVNGYEQSFLQAPTSATDQGDYVLALFQPSQLNTAATRAENEVLRKYGNGVSTPSGFSTAHGYTTGLLLIKGLQEAGPNPTRQGFIKNLRSVTSWTANGLEPEPVDFTTALSHPAVTSHGSGNCIWILKISGSKFLPVDKLPVCASTVSS
jgi:branched-chain amino acid transport system substrate-binding protein